VPNDTIVLSRLVSRRFAGGELVRRQRTSPTKGHLQAQLRKRRKEED
jgi:hypothetical protein